MTAARRDARAEISISPRLAHRSLTAIACAAIDGTRHIGMIAGYRDVVSSAASLCYAAAMPCREERHARFISSMQINELSHLIM